ncbi:MAG: FAD binding domain-containing protein [Ferrovibrionaceae bacterium]
MGQYSRPDTLDEALRILSAGSRTLLAGGTDHYPARVDRFADEDILDLTAIGALRGIAELADHWRLGALTTWTELAEAALPPLFDGYRRAAREVGGRQVQNAGTLGGNLCNASPAADGTPNLLALDARVELTSAAGRRELAIPDFVLGNRRTARLPDEIVTALIVPKSAAAARTAFAKLGARRYLVISIVMVAARLEVEGDRIARAGIAVGACSAVPQRLPALEARLVGQSLASGLHDLVAASDIAGLAPLDDVRGSAAYRRAAAVTLLRDTLAGLGQPITEAA